MNVNRNMFWILAGFFALTAVLYTVWSYIDYQNSQNSEIKKEQVVEWVGTVALSLSALLAALIAFYIGASRRAQGGELPEDRLDAEIDDGDPEVGFFSPWSWWPMVLALGAALFFLGFAVGIWLCFIGAPIAFLAIIGWYYEYYRGYFAR
ncbi:MAG TPA: cytochrome c oxidase subunit 4 [Pseudolysinimonas sp.]|nr:cytochrome c oxidase subunit 4 [Pseudolysinimonas sp.]